MTYPRSARMPCRVIRKVSSLISSANKAVADAEPPFRIQRAHLGPHRWAWPVACLGRRIS
jgi:hypothetical protein